MKQKRETTFHAETAKGFVRGFDKEVKRVGVWQRDESKVYLGQKTMAVYGETPRSRGGL